MVRITVDEEMRQKLLGASGVVELIDESGLVLARVLPENAAPANWEPITQDLTPEEYERRLNSTEPGISTADLISRLRSKP